MAGFRRVQGVLVPLLLVCLSFRAASEKTRSKYVRIGSDGEPTMFTWSITALSLRAFTVEEKPQTARASAKGIGMGIVAKSVA